MELAGGQILRSEVVISNADPKRTFLELVEADDLGEAFLRQVRRLKTTVASLKMLCALKDLPDFSAYLGEEVAPKDLAMVQICPSAKYYEESWADAQRGRRPRRPIVQVQIPSVYDPTLAPPGHHVMSMWVTHEPPHLPGGGWSEVREHVGEELLDLMSGYAPNLREVLVAWSVLTPEDIEAKVGLTDGNIRHLDMSPDQMLNRRPLPGWGDYRTPVEGLYLCGSGTHPMGEVTGAPGHNAAQVVLGDLGVR